MKNGILLIPCPSFHRLCTAVSHFAKPLLCVVMLAASGWAMEKDDDDDDRSEDRGRDKKRQDAPTASSPIALTRDDRFVWVVNPDNNSVSIIEVGGDVNHKIGEVTVGEDPRCVAITPNNRGFFVPTQRRGPVSVIDAETFAVIKTIKVGAEPVGCDLDRLDH